MSIAIAALGTTTRGRCVLGIDWVNEYHHSLCHNIYCISLLDRCSVAPLLTEIRSLSAILIHNWCNESKLHTGWLHCDYLLRNWRFMWLMLVGRVRGGMVAMLLRARLWNCQKINKKEKMASRNILFFFQRIIVLPFWMIFLFLCDTALFRNWYDFSQPINI